MSPDGLWRDLDPEPAVNEALDFADGEATREAIRAEAERVRGLASETERKRERAVLRDMRKRWSERFATACATMIAAEMRGHPAVGQRYVVQPDVDGGGQETFTPLGYKKGKRVDVVVSGPLVGLQVGISLKGLNFADDTSGNHDKNLTGRLYELRDEVSTVHDYLPRAFMGAVFFLPTAACLDKAAAPCSFAHVVAELRARTGRLDPSVAADAWRCDESAVGLYVPGDPIDAERGLSRGVVRYFPLVAPDGCDNLPPERGRPRVETTVDLPELIDQWIDSAIEGTAADIQFSAPEEGDETVAAVEAAEILDEIDAYDVDEDEDLEEDSITDPDD